MVATDSKGRTILKQEDAETVAMFLASERGHIKAGLGVTAEDWKDTRQALLAIAKAGWAIVPQGQLDGWKKILFEVDTPVNGGYLDLATPDLPSIHDPKDEPKKEK